MFLAAASRGWAGWTPPPPPPLPPRGWPRLAKNGWGGNLAKIKENEEKTATLGVPGGASQLNVLHLGLLGCVASFEVRNDVEKIKKKVDNTAQI